MEWNKYLDEIAKTKKIEVNGIKDKLVNCGKPGLSGTTVEKSIFLVKELSMKFRVDLSDIKMATWNLKFIVSV